MEKLIEVLRNQETQVIFEAIILIGGGEVSTDKRMARAALIEVYKEREGEEAADILMDIIDL